MYGDRVSITDQVRPPDRRFLRAVNTIPLKTMERCVCTIGGIVATSTGTSSWGDSFSIIGVAN